MLGKRCAQHALIGMVVAATSIAAQVADSSRLTRELAVRTFDTVWETIRTRHYDSTLKGVDWDGARRALRPRAELAKNRTELRAIIAEMLAKLNDSHVGIVAGNNVGSATREQTDGALGLTGGVGMDVRVIDSVVAVTRVDSGGPAFVAGVRAGWTIGAVKGIPLSEIRAALTRNGPLEARVFNSTMWAEIMYSVAGRPATIVDIAFVDERGRPAARTLTRWREPGDSAQFGAMPVAMARLSSRRIAIPGGRSAGLIQFNLWTPVLAAALDSAIENLRDADGIVVDLRGNLGGHGMMIGGVAGHFLDEPRIVATMRTRVTAIDFTANPRRSTADGRPVRPYAGPLVVLIDGLSISTAEVFAGGLQALGRARVIGEQSAGEVLGAVSLELPDGDVLLYPFADVVLANGARLERVGVVPDEIVALSRESLEQGADRALQAAIAWIARQQSGPTQRR